MCPHTIITIHPRISLDISPDDNDELLRTQWHWTNWCGTVPFSDEVRIIFIPEVRKYESRRLTTEHPSYDPLGVSSFLLLTAYSLVPLFCSLQKAIGLATCPTRSSEQPH